ncbi:MAG: ABC transporter permease [Bacilli bacterium]
MQIEFLPTDWGSLVFYLIIFIVGFVLGAYGGMFSESSGIINIALEGSMVVGGYSGIVFINVISSHFSDLEITLTTMQVEGYYLLASLIAIVAGMLFSFLLSIVSIRLKADQTIVGTAMNSVAIAVCAIINTFVTKKDSVEIRNDSFSSQLSFASDNEFLSSAFSGIHIGVIIGILAIIILWVVIKQTRFGLRLRACGENPAAADAVGINVNKMRYIGTMIGSAAASLGGFIIFSCMRTGIWTIDALGYGFLVLAIEIFGNWKPGTITLAAIFFAFFFAFAPTFTALLSNYSLPKSLLTIKPFYYMLPYLLAFLSLIIFSKKSHAPKAEGIPYDKGAR